MSTINIHLVRHGKAAAGFGTHRDPGLDATGQAQAVAVAERLLELGPLPLYSSPMARAYETALPLARSWQVPSEDIRIEPRVAEIPSPTDDLQARAQWLAQAMQGSWDDLDEPFQQWRQNLSVCLTQMRHSCVMFSHYVAINAAVGIATDDPRMRIFAPDNCSVTTLRNHSLPNQRGQLSVVSLGQTASTKIN